ncbi:RNA polymerase recycling motor HelD [Fictibacillus gelatini]|uniref:RNA polymerase recycling motor HelD n=1 Tax=Fictibacillus gelatini TaxID=225985 RepID=UPI00040A83EB|nr:RNA polymerase recycling motor HelD [Fictibacillus gelatini]
MSKAGQEWKKEQQRVDLVTDKIDKEIQLLDRDVSDVKSTIVTIRKNFWNDVTVNFDNPTETLETYTSIKQQTEMLAERERRFGHANDQLKLLKRLKQSPYFGRIDFKEENESREEQIYLGIGSFYDEATEQFLIYDWRAPISSLYYDYSVGQVEYETPGGHVTGTMNLKRQFIIKSGQIESMFDTSVTIGDELLQEVLGKHSDSSMKSIVATIQKEQNQIIRNEKSRLLIVQGAAGSGKTSAALQRVAYLLYRYRDTITADNIVLFSPNEMFNSYVSTVLPELGEENMQQTTFQEYLRFRVGKTFQLEDPFTQMEYTLTPLNEPDYMVRLEGIKYKASLDFMHVIDRYIEALQKEKMIFKDITFRDRILIPAASIQEKFYKLDLKLPIPNRLEIVTKQLLKELTELARHERKMPWVEEEIQLLEREDYLEAFQKLQSKKQYTENSFDDFEREQNFLAKMVVGRAFKRLRSRVKKLGFVDIPSIYKQLFTMGKTFLCDYTPEYWEEICLQTIRNLNRSQLSYEDATPYLYLKEKIEGFHTNNSVRHVFIDEAQDYSPFQFAFIKHLFPRSKMTVLGDVNQSIHAHSNGGGFAALVELFGKEQTETIVLNRSYRSTKPIVEFTRRMIDGGQWIVPFNREGSKPTVSKAENAKDLTEKIRKQIAELKEAGHQTIAIICKTASESKEAFASLKGEASLRLISKETTSFETGTVVIPAYLAKGVEFDAVIIYNATKGQYGKESERKLFYTACTRAMHELHIFFAGELTPFISGISPETYVFERS